MHTAEAAGKFQYTLLFISIDDVGVATAQQDFLQPTPGTDSYHQNESFSLYKCMSWYKVT